MAAPGVNELGDIIRELKKNIPCSLSSILSQDVNPEFIFLIHEAEDDLEKCRNPSLVLSRAQALLDAVWEQLNTGHWSKVSATERQVYTAAGLIKIQALLQMQLHEASGPVKDVYERALETADRSLLLGAPLPVMDGQSMHRCAQILTSVVSTPGTAAEGVGACRRAPWTSVDQIPGVSGESLPVLDRPSIERFRTEHFSTRLPVKLTGCMSHWPALSRWGDMAYLRRVAGPRTVPVELGAHYADPDWSQQLMTVSRFIDQHVTGAGRPLGYLAQHPLFDQVPELRTDIHEPEYCCLSNNLQDTDAAAEETDINAWFGPAGTVSPLHHDPKHNLLAQVVGEKRVLLYSPADSPRLYPHETTLLGNTAQVDPEQPDYSMCPEYRHASALECRLRAGEMLYIPPLWWHHVRALTTSFSVSFWWQ
ncbi:lysine-specific demethylase 8 [Bacillus rossius redtenbacheri]|uniref:lysine-specific demethylase 8 n=1 Tax=Bacillus rossius redtenbacheri TaxID=93214 RepID=UPI002FDC84C4